MDFLRHFWSYSPGMYRFQVNKAGVVLDDDQGVVGLFMNGHELKDREGSADLQVPEPASQLAQTSNHYLSQLS